MGVTAPFSDYGRRTAVPTWVKSSLSFANGNCVEVDLNWQKADGSHANNNCVETAKLPEGGVAVRNSRFPQAAHLYFTADEWQAFISGVKNGEFDLPTD